MGKKRKIAFYWAASCGGCEITVTELGINLIDFADQVDIIFWPAIMDFKYEDVRLLKKEEIDICFFNGAIRNTENEELAHLLRDKSRLLVAFGSCSSEGCIPGLANLYDTEAMIERVYYTTPSLDDTRGTRPMQVSKVPEGEIKLPMLSKQLRTLSQVVPVDYIMPGCPPVADQVWKVFNLLLANKLPEDSDVIGIDEKTVCDVCPREKGDGQVRIKAFKRPHEIMLDAERCFLTQGVICCGPVTRAGCGLPCLNANMPCRGCYGAPEGVSDQGSKLLSAITPIIDTDDPEQVQQIMDTIVDPVGTFYRFSLAGSLLNELKYNNIPIKVKRT